MASPAKPSLTPMKNPTKVTTPPQGRHESIAEAIAREHKKADDELGHRMAMNVLGEPGDPLKAAIEKAITGRVDIFGKLTKGPGSI